MELLDNDANVNIVYTPQTIKHVVHINYLAIVKSWKCECPTCRFWITRPQTKANMAMEEVQCKHNNHSAKDYIILKLYKPTSSYYSIQGEHHQHHEQQQQQQQQRQRTLCLYFIFSNRKMPQTRSANWIGLFQKCILNLNKQAMQSRNENLRIYQSFSWKQLIKVVHQYVIKGTVKS